VTPPSKMSVFITRSTSCPSAIITPHSTLHALTPLPTSTRALSPAEPLLTPQHLHTRRVLAPTSAGCCAALAGLSVGFFWNKWLHGTHISEDIFSYVLVRRLLPIIVVLTVTILTASMGRRIVQRWREDHHPLVHFSPALSQSLDGHAGVGADYTRSIKHKHEFFKERPDVDALVHTAVEEAREAGKRLVVASSGPSSIIGAVKSAVTQQRKLSGAKIEFFGVNAQW
jgi:hypothetical protein